MRPEAFEQFASLDRDHWWFRGRRAVYLGLLDRVLMGKRPGRALDLGCGPGGFLPGLVSRCASVLAADTDLGSLSALATQDSPAPSAARVASAAETLPFRARSFELVCLFDVLEHLDSDVEALREVHRVLAPGGLVAISVPAYPWLFANNDVVAMHRRRYTRAMLAAALEAAGFEIVRNTHANVLLTPLIVPLALLGKAIEATILRRRTSQHTNLSWPLPRFAHSALAKIFAAELMFTTRFDAPFGHSIAAFARRK